MLFSQRKGLTAVRSVIQIDGVDTDLRNALWNALWVLYNGLVTTPELRHKLMESIWLEYFKGRLNMFDVGRVFGELQERILHGEWYDVYDVLEVVHQRLPDELVKSQFVTACNAAFKKELSAYRFVGGQITPITSETEISEIETALTATHPLKPVYEHLFTALDYLSDRNSPDYRNSIKESISAVESLSNLITGEKSTLGEALRELETKVTIHPALKKGFSNIYGYTSDASGIRHGLLEEPNLDFEDAKFMLVACSAFVNYLIAKSDKAGISL